MNFGIPNTKLTRHFNVVCLNPKFTATRLDRNLGETSERRNVERSKSKQDLALPLSTTTALLDNESVNKRLVEEKPRDTPPPHYPTGNPLFQYSRTPHLFSASYIRTVRYGSALHSICRYRRCYVYSRA